MAKATKTEGVIKESKSIPAEEAKTDVQPLEEIKEPMTGEVEFLKHLLHLQEIGGWGKHLHPVINERINQLNAK